MVTISGTSITKIRETVVTFVSSVSCAESDSIKIIKVIGYK
jgi:hypothetical protein